MSDQTNSASSRMVIAAPAPTGMPLLAAAGIALALTGLVTSLVVSIIGVILAIVGFSGWFREVLPKEHREEITIQKPLVEVLEELEEVPLPVRHMHPGEEDHRARLPLEIYPYSAGIKGGIAGGFVMAILALLQGIVLNGSPWYTVNLLAAAVMPSLATASTATLMAFSLNAFLIAILLHGIGSILVGLLYGVLLPMLPRYPTLLAGIVAPLIWTGLLWSSLDVIDPLLNQRVEWRWFLLNQIAFGITAGIVVARSEKIRTLQHLSFALRSGIEAPMDSEDGR